MFITATIPSTVSGTPTHAGQRVHADDRERERCTQTPKPVGIAAASTCPPSFCHQLSPRKSSIAPTVVATAAPRSTPRSSPPSGRNASDGTKHPEEEREPAEPRDPRDGALAFGGRSTSRR